ncbi:MAG: hypothetical protein R6V28_07615 [Nitriliruptoraceae bacterium]
MSWPPDRDRYLEFGDHARLAEEVAARSERRSRLLRASEVATWAGTLADLVERRSPVVLRLAGSRTYRGALVALGRDHVAIRTPSGQVALVSISALRSVRPEPGAAAPPATGDRERSHGRTLAEVLERCTEESRRIVLGLDDVDELLTGEVIALGEDVVTFRVDAQDHGVLYLPVLSVREIVVDT